MLFIASSSELARIDENWQITQIGNITGFPELTGNGLGELWGFFPEADPVHVSRIDKTNASLTQTHQLPQLESSASAWAFAFWGGDFYIFYESGSDSSTNVYKVIGSSGQMEDWIPNSGKRIVGAGVSTCAPYQIE